MAVLSTWEGIAIALSSSTVWEVRTDGNDANGGGFVTGASGTDRSQQAAAQIAYTDLVIDGATNTKFTSAANPVTAAEVGNIVNVTGGTGFTVQRVQIVSQAAGVATCDKSLGTLGSTGGTGNLGGALLTIAQALTLSTVDAMTIYVRGGTYAITTALALPARSGSSQTMLIGYSTVRTDGGRPIISVTAAVNGLTHGTGWSVYHFELDGTSTGLVGVANAAGIGNYFDVRIHHFTGAGSSGAGTNLAWDFCEIDHCASGLTLGTPGLMSRSWIHDNTGTGMTCGIGNSVTASIISNNTGATSDGLVTANGECAILGNVIYGNGRDGIRSVVTDVFRGGLIARNNILASNAGYGYNVTSALTPIANIPRINYNAFFNNTSGARNNINASPNDVTLTADPFTNAAGNDFSLNATAGGGAACRGAGFPGVLPGL